MTNKAHHQPSSLPALLFKPPVCPGSFIRCRRLFVLAMLPLPRFAGERKQYLFTYHAPIAAVFVSYLFDRMKHYRRLSRWQWMIEPLVILVGLVRAVFTIPYVSGHALFSCLCTDYYGHSGCAWCWPLAVFLEVVYVKLLC